MQAHNFNIYYGNELSCIYVYIYACVCMYPYFFVFILHVLLNYARAISLSQPHVQKNEQKNIS